MTNANETKKNEARMLKMLRAGALDARCALPGCMADALARLVASGAVVRVNAVNGFGGSYRLAEG